MTTALMSPPDINVPEELLGRLRERTEDLNMLPAVATQALEVVKDPNCTISAFSAVVEQDVKLASDILGMANSVLYSTGVEVASLHQAVVRIGFRPCKNLILTSSMKSLMKKMTLEEEWMREMLWRHSYTTAMLGLHLNRSLRLGFQGEEFTAGLMHDLGRTLFAVCLPERFAEIDPLDFSESPATLEHERQVAGIDHCELGAWLTISNKLPDALTGAVRFHHEPERSDKHRRLTALVAAADHMANHIQLCDGPEGYDPQSNPAIPVLEDCNVPAAATRFAEIAEKLMESAVADAADVMAM